MIILFALSNHLILSSTLRSHLHEIFDNETENIGEPQAVHEQPYQQIFYRANILELFRLHIINEQLLYNYSILNNDQKLRPKLSVCY